MMNKKIIGILVCILFFGVGIVSGISGNIKMINNVENKSLIDIPIEEEWNRTLGGRYDDWGLSVSISGDCAVIGTSLEDNIGGDDAGSVYVFRQSGTSWKKEAKLLASDGSDGDYFGISVSVDGNYVVIGASEDDDFGYYSGSAYVFKCSGTSWTEEIKLIGSDVSQHDYFGRSVSLSGEYIIIGAYYDDDNGENSGSAYVFKRNGTFWYEQAKLLPLDGNESNFFGCSVSIDGDYAVIGADGYDSSSAYIFKRDGTTWTQQTKLIASGGGNFGCSVSIDGDYAIVGAMSAANSGAAYIFKRDGTSWVEEAKLLASDGGIYDRFGRSVSIDGEYAIIGASEDDNENGDRAGSAYVFKRNGTIWYEQAKLLASDGDVMDYFGYCVSLNGDYAVIGAAKDDGIIALDVGSAYIFKRSGTSWSEEAKLLALNKAKEVFNINIKVPVDKFKVDVSLVTPRNKALINTQPILQWLLQRFPIIRHLLS